jgi:hypothetical protein
MRLTDNLIVSAARRARNMAASPRRSSAARVSSARVDDGVPHVARAASLTVGPVRIGPTQARSGRLAARNCHSQLLHGRCALPARPPSLSGLRTKSAVTSKILRESHDGPSRSTQYLAGTGDFVRGPAFIVGIVADRESDTLPYCTPCGPASPSRALHGPDPAHARRGTP